MDLKKVFWVGVILFQALLIVGCGPQPVRVVAPEIVTKTSEDTFPRQRNFLVTEKGSYFFLGRRSDSTSMLPIRDSVMLDSLLGSFDQKDSAMVMLMADKEVRLEKVMPIFRAIHKHNFRISMVAVGDSTDILKSL